VTRHTEETIDMAHGLTAAEQDRARDDGYVLRTGVFSHDEVASIVEECERVVDAVVADRRGRRHTVGSYTFEPDRDARILVKWEGDTDVVHGIEPVAHLSPVLRRLAEDPRLVDPATTFTGDPSPTLYTEKLNLKRPRHGGRNPFHQDFPYWKDETPFADRTCTAMLFLDDATLENGTLEVLPGSHRDGQRPTWTDRDPFGNLETDETRLDTTTTVALEVPRGSVVWFGAFLVHRSGPNTSAAQRRSLLYSYQPAGGIHVLDLPASAV
jgi:ectoine hydroxylase-related dioxygenase (phytanoyl-CoA dioxygenase family)